MNLKYKVRTYNFWISLASAVILLVRLIGQRFGFEIDSNAFMDIATALCGVLVVLGIITMPVSTTNNKVDSSKQNLQDSENANISTDDSVNQQINDNTQNSNLVENAENFSNTALDNANIDENSNNKTEIVQDNASAEIEDFKLDTTFDSLKKLIENDNSGELVKEAILELSKNPDEFVKIVEQIINSKNK